MITEKFYLGTILFTYGIGLLVCLYQIVKLHKKFTKSQKSEVKKQ